MEAARIKKQVTKKAMAEHFGVSPPSIQDWVNRGTIDKSRLPELWNYFSDVADAAHWGLEGVRASRPSQKGNAVEQATAAVAVPPGVNLSARAFSLANRLDGIRHEEHRRIAYALMSNILDQYEGLQEASPAPHQATKRNPPAKRTAARQPSR
ncbi:hypothetical protein WDZ92_30200 [Nostoc sp. NIES-2111]